MLSDYKGSERVFGMPRVEGEPGFREKIGSYAIAGGIVAGGIGLLVSGELLLLGAIAAAGGYVMKKSGERV